MAPGLVVDLHDASHTTINLTNPIAKQPSTITTTELITTSGSTSTPSSPTSPIALHDPTLVLHPSSVTTEFDELRFHAAAYEQLPKDRDSAAKSLDGEEKLYSTDLISSPYNSPGHFLSLSSPTLPLPSILFARALTALAPTSPSYATAPYTEALNFDRVLEVLRDQIRQYASASSSNGEYNNSDYVFPATDFYVVVFRSKLKTGIDLDYLYKLDFESHREACESGGLLKYWFGKTNELNQNLATCFWHSREDAYKGGLGPWHLKARKAGRELYEKITFGTWKFSITSSAQGWSCVEWV